MRFLEKCAVLVVVALVQGCDILATNRSARAVEKVTVRAGGPCDVTMDHERPTWHRDVGVDHDTENEEPQ